MATGVATDRWWRSLQKGMRPTPTEKARVHHRFIESYRTRPIIGDAFAKRTPATNQHDPVAFAKFLDRAQRHQLLPTWWSAQDVDEVIDKVDTVARKKNEDVSIVRELSERVVGYRVTGTLAGAHILITCHDDRYRVAVLHEVLQANDTKTLVLVESSFEARQMAEALSSNGLPTLSLREGRDNTERDWMSRLFKNSNVMALVSTDDALRSMWFPDVHAVVNMGLPPTVGAFFGRLSFAARKAMAITIAPVEAAECNRDLIDVLVRARVEERDGTATRATGGGETLPPEPARGRRSARRGVKRGSHQGRAR